MADKTKEDMKAVKSVKLADTTSMMSNLMEDLANAQIPKEQTHFEVPSDINKQMEIDRAEALSLLGKSEKSEGSNEVRNPLYVGTVGTTTMITSRHKPNNKNKNKKKKNKNKNEEHEAKESGDTINKKERNSITGEEFGETQKNTEDEKQNDEEHQLSSGGENDDDLEWGGNEGMWDAEPFVIAEEENVYIDMSKLMSAIEEVFSENNIKPEPDHVDYLTYICGTEGMSKRDIKMYCRGITKERGTSMAKTCVNLADKLEKMLLSVDSQLKAMRQDTYIQRGNLDILNSVMKGMKESYIGDKMKTVAGGKAEGKRVVESDSSESSEEDVEGSEELQMEIEAHFEQETKFEKLMDRLNIDSIIYKNEKARSILHKIVDSSDLYTKLQDISPSQMTQVRTVVLKELKSQMK
ncbi:TPA_asm: P [Justicia betacytorhabdovirus 1]|nr:TPA_asm: P [Justicia betacytorhabdovirus 1]